MKRRRNVRIVRSILPGDAEFEGEFSRARVTRSHIARYYLRAIEDHVKGLPGYKADDDETKIDLEHIMLQNPSKAWKVSDDKAKWLSPRLGNLVLLRTVDNRAVGNDDFPAKKTVLSKSVYETTQWAVEEVGTGRKWEESHIEARQKRLAAEAPKVWPIDVK